MNFQIDGYATSTVAKNITYYSAHLNADVFLYGFAIIIFLLAGIFFVSLFK